MKLSLIIPSYNQGRFVREAVNSIVDQALSDVECIVVDGASTDRTVEVLKEYGTGIQWASSPDDGQSDAINKGVTMSSGDYVGWLCSDDLLCPGSLATVTRILSEFPGVDVVHGDVMLTDVSGGVQDLRKGKAFDLCQSLSEGTNFFNQPGSFCKREAWDRVGGLRKNLHYVMDWDLCLRLAATGSRFHYVPQTLAISRFHDDAKTKGTGGYMKMAGETVLSADLLYAEVPFLDENVRRLENKAKARANLVAGMMCYEALDMRAARSFFMKAMCIDPRVGFEDRGRLANYWLRSFLGKTSLQHLRRIKARLFPRSPRGTLDSLRGLSPQRSRVNDKRP